MLKNNKGITITSLIEIIIILFILASITVYSGVSTVKYTKFMKAKAEMETMQAEVNSLYQEYQHGNEEVLNHGTDEGIAKYYDFIEKLDIGEKSDYRIFYSGYITDVLGVEGINYDFVINIKEREIILVDGITYQGKTYYTLHDFGIENIKSNPISSIDFDLGYGALDSKKEEYDIFIYNIKFYDKENKKIDVSKYTIEYKKNDSETWEKLKEPETAKYVTENSEGKELEYDAYLIPIKIRGTYQVKISTNDKRVSSGETEHTIDVTNIPQEWQVISNYDNEWYAYTDISTNKVAKVNAPVLSGNMRAIQYQHDATGSKWANAITIDGSMWVWIPRFAYKITEGYHTSTAGTIEIMFLDTANNPLNGEDASTTATDISKKIVVDPTEVTYTDDAQNEWLVHPAFTSNAETGGGFGELKGIWIAKFETSGELKEGSGFKSLPGVTSLRSQTIGDFYTYARQQLYGEFGRTDDPSKGGDNYKSFGGSHIAKNSEWGAITYLAHSTYGTNKTQVGKNTNNEYITGGTVTVADIYDNATQSTTLNACGIYDLNGGTWEYVAAYVDNGSQNLSNNGGTSQYSLYGASAEERATSTKYKTVYEPSASGTELDNYNLTVNTKGTGIYETSSGTYNSTVTWQSGCMWYPKENNTFFSKGGNWEYEYGGIFCNSNTTGLDPDLVTCRLVLVF